MCMGLYYYVEDVEHLTDVAIFFIIFAAEIYTQLYCR
jgi:hypothetical protein